VLSDRSGDRSAGGRRFHVAGPSTAKLRCPVAVAVTCHLMLCHPFSRRCWRIPQWCQYFMQKKLNKENNFIKIYCFIIAIPKFTSGIETLYRFGYQYEWEVVQLHS